MKSALACLIVAFIAAGATPLCRAVQNTNKESAQAVIVCLKEEGVYSNPELGLKIWAYRVKGNVLMYPVVLFRRVEGGKGREIIYRGSDAKLLPKDDVTILIHFPQAIVNDDTGVTAVLDDRIIEVKIR